MLPEGRMHVARKLGREGSRDGGRERGRQGGLGGGLRLGTYIKKRLGRHGRNDVFARFTAAHLKTRPHTPQDPPARTSRPLARCRV